MDGISAEAMQRMEALVRRIVDFTRPDGHPNEKGAYPAGVDVAKEAHEIVALLPTLPDPDIAEAREAAAFACEASGANPDYVKFMRDGMYDETDNVVKAALAGIKRGRELAARS